MSALPIYLPTLLRLVPGIARQHAGKRLSRFCNLKGKAMNQEKPLGTGWFTFVNYVWLPCTIIWLLISAIVVLANWNSNSAEPFTEIVISLGIQIALFVGMQRRKQWAWWLLMFTMFVGGPSAAYNRYAAHAEWIDLCNEASQQMGGIPISTNPEQYIALGVAAFLLFGVPNLIYFYRRRKWFGVDFTENADENKPGETANTIQPKKAEQAPNAIKAAGYSENAESDDRELYAQVS